MNQPIPFVKMSGSGNDFVVIDNRQEVVAEQEVVAFTQAVCRRGLGLGADGVILIEHASQPDLDFRWRYLNADGSVGELCGNGAMCGARFAVKLGIAPSTCRFETPAGVVEATVPGALRNPMVEIRIADVDVPGEPVALAIDGHVDTFTRILVGVPHAVAFVDDADAFVSTGGFAAWGRQIRHNRAFAPAGTNVNAVHVIDAHTLRMRTWERGVEAETLACGTGAVASAIVAATAGRVIAPVSVRVSSGQVLTVGFTREGQRIASIHLGGEARFVARGELDPEGFR